MSSQIKYNGLTTDANTDPILKIVDSSDNEKARMDSSGKMGIGLTSLVSKFEVLDNGFVGHTLARLSGDDTGVYPLCVANNTSSTGDDDGMLFAVYDNGNGLIAVHNGVSYKDLIIGPAGGKVAIGTATATALLTVDGDAVFNESGADKDLRVEGDTDQNLLFIDASADKIGIATNAPATLLDVRGQVSANAGSASSPAYSFVSDLNTGMYSPSADALSLATGGTERLRIDSSGNAGLGATIIGARLTVASSGNTTTQLQLTNTQTGGKTWSITDGADSSNGVLSIRNTDGAIVSLLFDSATANTRTLRVGKVTGAPSGKEIMGVGQSADHLGSDSTYGSIALKVDYSFGAPSGFPQIIATARKTDNTGFDTGRIRITQASNGTGDMLFQVNTGSGLVDCLYIKNDATVGIFTTSPTEKLEVNGNLKITDGGNLLKLSVKSTTGDPTGVAGAMYYSSYANKLRAYVNGNWCTVNVTVEAL